MSRDEVYVFRAGSLGDTIVSLPAWQAVARRHSSRPLHLITPSQRIAGIPDTADVYQLTGRLGEVIRYDTSWAGLTRTAAAVRQVGRGIVYCLMPERPTIHHLRDLVFMRLVLGLKTRGVMSAIRLNKRRNWARAAGARLPEWQRLLTCAGGDASSLTFPLLEPTLDGCETAGRLLDPFGTAPFLVACPGSKMPAKRWAGERYQAVFQGFLESHREARVVLVGSPDERELCHSIAASHPDRMLNLAGQLSLDQSVAVFARAVCYLGNDTGAMHLAAAMGRPCVAVFSARDFRGKWEPFGSEHTILREEPACQHCMLTDCTAEKMKCLTMIGVPAVERAINVCWQKAVPATRTAKRDIKLKLKPR
jgi:heptosyltransferase III